AAKPRRENRWPPGAVRYRRPPLRQLPVKDAANRPSRRRLAELRPNRAMHRQNRRPPPALKPGEQAAHQFEPQAAALAGTSVPPPARQSAPPLPAVLVPRRLVLPAA